MTNRIHKSGSFANRCSKTQPFPACEVPIRRKSIERASIACKIRGIDTLLLSGQRLPPKGDAVKIPARSTAMLFIALFLRLPTAQADSLDSLARLAGCWAQEAGEAGTIEIWMKPAGDTMLGMSRTVRGGKTVGFEFMQIRLQGGSPVSIAQPSNQKEASFPASRISAHEVVFENAAHDFPQRIIYGATTPERLHARIEGLRNGELTAVEFPMRKVPCDG
jgi:hypothetical protein